MRYLVGILLALSFAACDEARLRIESRPAGVEAPACPPCPEPEKPDEPRTWKDVVALGILMVCATVLGSKLLRD